MRCTNYGKEAVQSGIQAVDGPDGQLHLHPQGDLPPGDHLQRQRRHRQAGLSFPDGRHSESQAGGHAHHCDPGQGHPDPHGVGQRRGHDRPGAGAEPGHHRAQRLPPVQGGHGKGQRGGHHRPVRRGLLLRLHGGGRGHRHHPPPRGGHGPLLEVLRGGRLHHHRMRKGRAGHRRHHAHQGRRRGGNLRRVPGDRPPASPD